jgi:rfaE bifunctional protein kinase chain/domain
MPRIELERLEQILRNAADVKVAVVGDLMLDIYLTGAVERISPEAPVPVVHVTEERSALGGAANVAANVLRLGATCDIIGFVGDDASGAQLRRGLAELEGGAVRAHLVSDGIRPTTTKTRVMARKQQVVRFDREQEDELPSAALAALCDFVTASVREANVLILEDYNKGVLAPSVIRTAIRAAQQAAVPVVVDPKFRNIFEYAGATVFKPNALELSRALGIPNRIDDEDWLDHARNRFDCQHLLVTMGEAGMVVRSDDATTFRVPAIAREVYDVSGAGDTVTAFVAVGLAAGATIREATIFANYAAAIEVAKPGVAPVSPDEMREIVIRHSTDALV